MQSGTLKANMALLPSLCLASLCLGQQLIVDDPLTNGTTVGVRDNGQGQFVAGQGWKVTSYSDNIRYTPATPIEDGSVEFNVKGLVVSDDVNPDGQLMTMYDASFGNPRFVYAPDLRLNPYKFVWHRYGDDLSGPPPAPGYHQDEFKLIMNCTASGQPHNQFEDYSALGPYPWNAGTTYLMKMRWRDGVVRFYLDGNETDHWPWFYKEVYKPGTHDIRIGTNTRNNAIINAIYSNVKIYDYGTVPTAPYINNPRSGSISKTLTPTIDWTGERHDQYEVHVTTGTSPTTGIVWNSGVVSSALHYAVSGPLANSTTYYAHVRLHNAKGWGSWSAPQQFQTSTGGTINVSRYGEHEVVLLADADYPNPYLDVTLSATFSGPGTNITIAGFWDGGRLYKIRMLPTVTGNWTWTTSSNRPSLNAKTGSFTCVSSSNKGYVRVSPAFPYTFEWAGDSTPFFLLGDTIWHMWYNIRYSDNTFQSMIDPRAAQHFNYAHGVVHDWPHNEGGNLYSQQMPNPIDPNMTAIWNVDTLSPGYFHWVDKKVDYMNSKGMIASLFFAWGNEGYATDYQTATQYQNYARYLVARYASKNVIWIIVGEYEEAGEPNSRWIDYMNTVYNNDPYKHPISLHTVNTTNAFGNELAHSFVSQQRQGTPSSLRADIASSRIFNKPVINLEYGYEGDPATFPANQNPDNVRKDHYAIVLAGGYAVYGNNLVPFQSTYHVTEDFNPTATNTLGAQYMKFLYEFFEDTSFHRLSPSQSLVNVGICAAWADNEYVVQLETGGGVNLNLSAATGTFYVDWYNPRTNVRTPAGTTTGGGVRSFTAPDSNDWILHVHRNQIDPGAPTAAINANPTSGAPPLLVNFNGSGSFDPDGTIVSYAWDFDNNGTTDATGVTASNTYAEGTYTAKLTVTDNQSKTGTATVQIQSGDSVTVDLGSPDVPNGLTLVVVADGDTTPVSIGGRSARQNLVAASDNYFYFAVSDAWAYQGSKPTQYITIDYYDAGTASLTLQYDASDGTFYKSGGSITRTNTNTWKQHTYSVTDAYFGNRQNGGADFRIFGGTNNAFYLDVIKVSPFPPAAMPPGQASNPNPANTATGVDINADLMWSAGNGATSHDVYFGTDSTPDSSEFKGNQAGTTYNPGTLSPNTTYYWQVDEKNAAGTTTGVVWSFTTLPVPGQASSPSPASGATGVSISVDPTWTAGSNATSHDVRFGTTNPPPFVVTQTGTTFDPGTLVPSTTYFWRIDENNTSGTTTGVVWSFTTGSAVSVPTLNVKVAGAITIDGSSSDWNLSDFVTKVHGGELTTGDYGIVGFDGASLYYAGRYTAWVLPTSATDHTARIYSRHDSSYQYFLVRIDDSNIQTPNGVASNWANDCVEFYIDPSNNGGASPMSNSTSDIQLVIDAINQKNVYMTTSGYATQVLGGVTSAVTTDGTGWWLEVRIAKSALDPDLPATGTFGVDFAFRDNDSNSDPAQSTMYSWSDTEQSLGFPSKIPNRWGDGVLAVLAPPGQPSNPSPANGATGVSTSADLSWTAGLDATSHDVRFGTTNPPPFVINQTATTYDPGTLAASTTYYWRIDEKNGAGTTNGPVWSFTTGASSPVQFFNSPFASGSESWTIVTWKAGQYGLGTMAFDGTTGNPAGSMKSTGSGSSNNADSCTREGGEIKKVISTVGYTAILLNYDLRYTTDQTGATCVGTCLATVLEGDCADKLAVYYSTAGINGPWTLLETVNAASVSQNVWLTRAINLPAGANNSANFTLRFRFQFNTGSDIGLLDNIKLTGTP